MIETSLKEIFTKANIEEAIDHLGSKRDVCGPDGIALSELPHYWEVNGRKIKESILKGTYKPGLVQTVDIVNHKGKRRKIYVMNAVDRLVLRTIAQVLQPQCDALLEENCFAFREGMGVMAAVNKAGDYIEAGCKWMVRVDIKDYYDSLPISGMQSLIAKTFSDSGMVTLLHRYLTIKIEDEGRVKRKRKGILTGSPISPLLANLYLTTLDRKYKELGEKYCRYVDDIVLFFHSRDEAEAGFKKLEDTLNEKYSLTINQQKSGIFKPLQEVYLGYEFERSQKDGSVTAVRKRKNAQSVYRGWKQDGVQLVDRNYHLVNDGVLTRRDYTLLFDNEDGKKYIPVETTDSITVYSNVVFASDVFRFLSRKRIYVAFVDRYGEIVGFFAGPGSPARSRTMMRQSDVYLDKKKRLNVARAMEQAFVHNMISNLKYYGRRTKSERIKEWLSGAGDFKTDINEAKSVDAMMLSEARCRQEYYGLFNEMIRQPEFTFTSRTRRPPKDALNAMISFGNTLLYNRIAMEINKTSLDIRIGIVHSTTNRSQSLNLDIADLFKPIIVDRTIFTLINKRAISLERDFITNEDGSVYLSNTGKRIFISEFNSKLHQKLTERGKSVTYDTKIKQEISKLYRFFVHGEPYKPYKYINY